MDTVPVWTVIVVWMLKASIGKAHFNGFRTAQWTRVCFKVCIINILVVGCSFWSFDL